MPLRKGVLSHLKASNWTAKQKMSQSKIRINKNLNPDRPDLRGMKPETVQEFFARGGRLKKLPSFMDIWNQWIRREFFGEIRVFEGRKRYFLQPWA